MHRVHYPIPSKECLGYSRKGGHPFFFKTRDKMCSHVILYHFLCEGVDSAAEVICHRYGKQSTITCTNLHLHSNNINAEFRFCWLDNTTSLPANTSFCSRNGMHRVKELKCVGVVWEFVGKAGPMPMFNEYDLNKLIRRTIPFLFHWQLVSVLQTILARKHLPEQFIHCLNVIGSEPSSTLKDFFISQGQSQIMDPFVKSRVPRIWLAKYSTCQKVNKSTGTIKGTFARVVYTSIMLEVLHNCYGIDDKCHAGGWLKSCQGGMSNSPSHASDTADPRES